MMETGSIWSILKISGNFFSHRNISLSEKERQIPYYITNAWNLKHGTNKPIQCHPLSGINNLGRNAAEVFKGIYQTVFFESSAIFLMPTIVRLPDSSGRQQQAHHGSQCQVLNSTGKYLKKKRNVHSNDIRILWTLNSPYSIYAHDGSFIILHWSQWF